MWSSRKNGHGLEVGRGNALKMNGNLFACLGGHLGRQELAATVSAVCFFAAIDRVCIFKSSSFWTRSNGASYRSKSENATFEMGTLLLQSIAAENTAAASSYLPR